MTYASIRAAAEHLARVGSVTPHQMAALQALDESLTTEQKQEFTELWRAQGSPAAAPPAPELVTIPQGGRPVVELQQTLGRVTPSSPFSTLLTPHIRLGEFALNQEARRFHHQYQVDTAIELATFLERARAHFGGKPVIITSGYRPAAINRSVGGASGSEHLFNAPGVGAVDWLIQGVSVKVVQDWCDRHWAYSLGYGAPKGFIHLGIRAGRPRVRWDY